jgi:hypothetical protein
MFNIYPLFFSLLLFLSSQLMAGEYAVTPMLVEMESSPKKTESFSFQVFGKSAGMVKVTPWDMAQQLSGHMGFISPEASDQSLASWLTIDNPRFSIKKGEGINVTGKITIPTWANGSYHTALMVEEVRASDAKGVVLNVRYAVILNIAVKGKRSRIKTDFRTLKLVEQDNKLYISGRFKNLSNRDYRLNSKVQLRDSNNRLISQVKLKTQSAWQRNDDHSRVFPEAEVELFGLIDKPLGVGSYQAIVRNNFGNRHQPTFRDALIVTNALHKVVKAKNNPRTAIQLLPNKIKMKVRRNGHTSSTMVLVNHHPYAVEVNFPSDSKTEQQPLTQYHFSPATVLLQPNGRSMVMLKQAFKDSDNVQAIKHRAQVIANGKTEWLDIRTHL